MIKGIRVLAMSLAMGGLLVLLTACSDNKGQDAASSSKEASPAEQSQKAGDQASGQPPAADGGKCAALLTAKCTECHAATRICEKIGKKSKARWQRSIARMTERGAKLNAEEAAALLVCLDSGGSDLQSACR